MGTTAENVAFATTATLGVVDIGKTITVKCLKGDNQLLDICEIAGVILFRVGETLQALSTIEQVLRKIKKSLNTFNKQFLQQVLSLL